MLKKGSISILLTTILMICTALTGSARVIIEEVGTSIFPSHFMPSEGPVGALVIPVEFLDFRFQEDPVDTLEAMFNGEGTALVPSVADYFQQSSYGEMQLSAGIQPVVRLSGTRKSYSGNYAALIQELLAVLVDRGVNLLDFDQNGDGILDGLYIIWAGAAQSADSDWWPYSDTFYFEFKVSGIQIGSFSSLSYELMTGDSVLRQYTAIHETGHQLGLTDYYADAYTNGTGAAVMMDRNEGDEDCFSKTLLGWISPQIVTSSCYITLRPISTESDAVLIAPSFWDGNYLSEYFMAEYVMPEANQGSQPLSADGGVRVWHVNAATSQWTDDVTTSMYRYSNSGDGPKLLSVVDPVQEWYGSGEAVSEKQTVLYTGESSGIAIRVESIENGCACLCITYFGEEPAPPEASKPPVIEESEQHTEEVSQAEEDAAEYDGAETKDWPGEASEEDVADEGIIKEEITEEEAVEKEAVGDESAAEENAAGSESLEAEPPKDLRQAFPVLFLIGLGFLVYLLLKGDKKRKNKKRRKRKK